MQNTRLNRLTTVLSERLGRWLRNPWRRISLLGISFLIGTFFAIVLATVAGQAGRWDTTVAMFVLLFTEGVNWMAYRNRPFLQRPLWMENLNTFKIGVVYGLFLLAFLVGS